MVEHQNYTICHTFIKQSTSINKVINKLQRKNYQYNGGFYSEGADGFVMSPNRHDLSPLELKKNKNTSS